MKYTTEIQKAQFDKNGLAIIAGWAEVYICDTTTREYLKAEFDNVPFGGSVVADAYLDKPELPAKQNVAIIRSDDEKSWIHVADHRGQTAYCTETRHSSKIDFIGELPPTLTLLEPKTGFDVWNGKNWVIDTQAQKAAVIAEAEQQKKLLLVEANNVIAPLQDSVDLGMVNDKEIFELKMWKTYRVLLNRIDTSTTPNIQWPQKP